MKKRLLFWIILIAVVAGGLYAYDVISHKKNYDTTKFAAGNGRLEATEINVAAKLAGRIDGILVEEGDLVKKGQKLVQMQTNVLEAELLQAEAARHECIAGEKCAEANVVTAERKAESEKATVSLKKEKMDGAEKRYKRAKQMIETNAISEQQYEDDETAYLTAKSDYVSAEAKYQQAVAEIETAKASLEAAKASTLAAVASKAKIQADIDDSSLFTPCVGRVQYKVAQVGEVMSAGGRVINIADFSDVYISFFLPETISGQVAIGADVKIVLDALKNIPIPAKITYVSSVAQFTPKTVETESERQKMMFRVKARVDEKLLADYLEYVKTGLPGMAYVRLDPEAEWPKFLQGSEENVRK